MAKGKCNVCGNKTVSGYKLCSKCRSYWRNKKRVYAKKAKTVSRRSPKRTSWWRW